MARRDTAARRYAEAAFDIARRDGTVDDWRRELDLAASTLADERLARTLSNPALPFDGRREVIDRVLGDRVSRPVRNIVQLLLRRGRIEDLARVAEEYRRLHDRLNGLTHATATSTLPLEADEVRALTARLEAMTGDRVELDTTVDPDLLGGIVVRVGDRLIDGSVRGRLERLRHRLVSGAL